MYLGSLLVRDGVWSFPHQLSDEERIDGPTREGKSDEEIVALVRERTRVRAQDAWLILARARGELDEIERESDI